MKLKTWLLKMIASKEKNVCQWSDLISYAAACIKRKKHLKKKWTNKRFRNKDQDIPRFACPFC